MLRNFYLNVIVCCMFMSCCPAGCFSSWAQDGGGGSDAPVIAAPSGMRIITINGNPVESEECQVCSEDGTSAWLPRDAAEELLETLKAMNPDKSTDDLKMTCRYK